MIPGPLSYRDFRETGPWPFISGVTSTLETVQGLHTPWKKKKHSKKLSSARGSLRDLEETEVGV